MAKNTRKGPQLTIAAIVTTLIVGGAAAAGSYYWANQNAYAAKVNGEVISTTEYISFVERAKKQYAGQIGMDFNSESGRTMLTNLKENVMNSLVDMAVMKQAAKEMGLSVTKEEEDKQFQELLKGKFQGNEEAFEKALADNKITRAEFDKQSKEQILLQKMYQKVVGDAKVEDKDIQAFYKENKAKFETPEQVEAQHILIKADPDNAAEVKQAEQKALTVITKLKGGAKFADLAKEYSQDDSNKDKGGDLGAFGKGQMVPEFEDTAFALKPGEFTQKPVKTRFGWHVIKRGKTLPASTRKLEEVKPMIMGQLQQTKQQEVFEKWLKETKEKANIKINEEMLKVPEAPPASASPDAAGASESALPGSKTDATPADSAPEAADTKTPVEATEPKTEAGQ